MDNAANAYAIAEKIVESGADAVYLFEAAALKSALPRLQQTYPHRLGCYTGTPGCDLVILSKDRCWKAVSTASAIFGGTGSP